MCIRDRITTLLFTNLTFTNEIILITSSEQNLQHSLNIWEKAISKKNVITISTKIVLKIRQASQHNIVVCNSEIEQVDSFRYLGAVFSEQWQLQHFEDGGGTD